MSVGLPACAKEYTYNDIKIVSTCISCRFAMITLHRLRGLCRYILAYWPPPPPNMEKIAFLPSATPVFHF